MTTACPHVLIAVPNNNPKHVLYLPTIWGNLKSFCEQPPAAGQQLSSAGERYTWLDPVIVKGTPADLLRPYEDTAIDVLGLSCYSWNTNTNLALAAEVRARNPECLVIAGGPHLDYRYSDFFADHPYVDAIVLRDGEVPFRMALEQYASGALDLASIPGLVLPPGEEDRRAGRRHVLTAPAILPTDFSRSPWLENADYFEDLMARLRREAKMRPIGIPWEIDRGCPYTCSFCDWGSNTNSKVRNFPLDRVRAEAEWIARNKIHVNFITIANFGSMPRDEEILQYVIEEKRRHGFPRIFIWNNAKNNVHRVVSMNEKAFDNGIVDFHILSVQSLDDEVLAAMGRRQIDKRHLIEVVQQVSRRGIPCVAQLIFGGPADTPERFARTLTGLMELGVHDEYIAYPFDVLANAPAADPAYREKWGVRTVTRRGAVNRRDPKQDTYDYSTIIVGTHSHDEREFVDMYVWGRLIIALHNSGLTQFMARYLRRTHDVPYYDFYTTVIDELFVRPGAPWHGIYQTCHDHIAAFIGPEGDTRVESIALEDLPDFDYLFQIEEYLLFKLMRNLDGFYDELCPFVEMRFGPIPLLDSLRQYQQGLMIDPSYDRRVGRIVSLDRDWPLYFAAPDDAGGGEPAARAFNVVIDRTHSGSQFQHALDWFEKAAEPDGAIRAWTQIVLGKHYQRVERAYFKGVGGPARRTPIVAASAEDAALKAAIH